MQIAIWLAITIGFRAGKSMKINWHIEQCGSRTIGILAAIQFKASKREIRRLCRIENFGARFKAIQKILDYRLLCC